MTHLCYTLEEAAGKLKLTETVLVRLSQYFKVPKAAYEESGYLSFKGDLAFAEHDIDFFRQAKERLLLGESLDEVKSRVRQQAPSVSQATAEPASFTAHLSSQAQADTVGATPIAPKATAQVDHSSTLVEPLRDIQDRQPYEKAVEQSFERYKSVHRTGLGKVFENMLKEVGSTRKEKPQAAAPILRPMRPRTTPEPASKPNRDRLLPFDRSAPPAPIKASEKPAKSGMDPSWEQIIKQAVDQPRSMNTHLKGAAVLLRERAMGNAPQWGNSGSMGPLPR